MEPSEVYDGFEGYISSGISIFDSFLRDRELLQRVELAVTLVRDCLEAGNPILVAGNGGSASDALHISGELVGKFYRDRPAQNVICLNSNVTVLTAWSNDVSFDSVFERQVEAHGSLSGLLWGLSTSGNSRNLVRAFQRAKSLGMRTLAMTGVTGGALRESADLLIAVPSDDTPRIQEVHALVYHYVCREVEKSLY